MTYSVWVPAKRAYDYYEDSKPDDGRAPASRSLPKGRPVSSHAAGYALPSGARKVGSGETAKGMIATRSSGFALGDFPASVGTIGLIAAAYVAYRVLR